MDMCVCVFHMTIFKIQLKIHSDSYYEGSDLNAKGIIFRVIPGNTFRVQNQFHTLEN